jgi:hypothetical protein
MVALNRGSRLARIRRAATGQVASQKICLMRQGTILFCVGRGWVIPRLSPRCAHSWVG